MKRATLLLDDAIYERAKRLSRERGTTLKAILNDLLRVAFTLRPSKEPVIIQLPLHRGNGPRPGVDIADRVALYDLLDGRGHRPQG